MLGSSWVHDNPLGKSPEKAVVAAYLQGQLRMCCAAPCRLVAMTHLSSPLLADAPALPSPRPTHPSRTNTSLCNLHVNLIPRGSAAICMFGNLRRWLSYFAPALKISYSYNTNGLRSLYCWSQLLWEGCEVILPLTALWGSEKKDHIFYSLGINSLNIH